MAQIIGAACFKWIIESFMDLVSFHSLGSGDAMKFVYAKSKMSMLLKIYYYLYIEFKFLMLWLMHMFRKKNSQIGFWKLFSLLKVKEVNFWHEKEVENF